MNLRAIGSKFPVCTFQTKKTAHSKSHSKVDVSKISKPPLIYVQNVENINTLNNALKLLPNTKYGLKILNNNETKIQAKESNDYSSIIKLLKDKQAQYYTFKPKEQRGFKVILHNMHYSTNRRNHPRTQQTRP